MWEKLEPSAPLVGIQNGVAMEIAVAMENNMQIDLKNFKTKLPYDPAIAFLDNYPNNWNQDLKELLALLCPLQLHSLQPEVVWMDRQKCDTYIK